MGVLNRDQISSLRDLWDYLDTLPKDKLDADLLCFWLEAIKDNFSSESNTFRAVQIIERKLYNESLQGNSEPNAANRINWILKNKMDPNIQSLLQQYIVIVILTI